ncbi:MAG TPA: hypothetical protein VK028_14830 [Micromonosporaceae bacterium]|nr:hypothetical protein [Micromonosporaceae bacterium]
MPEEQADRGGRTDQLIERIVVLVAALAAVAFLVLLPDPAPSAGPAPAPTLPPAVTWTGPEPVTTPARLPDGSLFQPRIFLTAQSSVGLATGGTQDRLLLRTGAGDILVIRSAPAGQLPQFGAFAADGDTLVWAESVAGDASVATSLWRLEWRDGGSARQITTDVGETSFTGGQYDLVVHGGRLYWTAVAQTRNGEPVTEVRSVPLSGGRVDVRDVPGEYGLSAWPWLVSIGGGRGTSIELLNLVDDERIKVPTEADEITSCSPAWCRVGVLGAGVLQELDLMRPDGSQRRSIAGPDSTPVLVDVAVLDRFVPLATDRDPGSGVIDLSLYDIERGRFDLVALDVTDIQGEGSIIWWSTGAGAEQAWHALDLGGVE